MPSGKFTLGTMYSTAAIGNTDMAGASIELAFQKAMLEASQLAFVKISQLSLFNQL